MCCCTGIPILFASSCIIFATRSRERLPRAFKMFVLQYLFLLLFFQLFPIRVQTENCHICKWWSQKNHANVFIIYRDGLCKHRDCILKKYINHLCRFNKIVQKYGFRWWKSFGNFFDKQVSFKNIEQCSSTQEPFELDFRFSANDLVEGKNLNCFD